MSKSSLFLTVFFVCISVWTGGCSGKKIDENDPAAMYQDAESEIENEHYQIAIDKLRVVKNKFPYSKYSTEAQLRIADVYFLQENFLEAAASYEGFVDLHPKHEKVEYALFRSAESYENDSPGNIARDLTSVARALSTYNEFVRRFAKSSRVTMAQKSIALLRETLAQKELYIGDFYRRQKDYPQAKNRYNKVLSIYSDTPSAHKARERLTEIERKT